MDRNSNELCGVMIGESAVQSQSLRQWLWGRRCEFHIGPNIDADDDEEDENELSS